MFDNSKESMMYDHLNKLMNDLYHLSMVHKAAALCFLEVGLTGFASLMKNEGSERWGLGSTVCRFIRANGGNPKISGQEAPPDEYINALACLTQMIAYDEIVLSDIKMICDLAIQENYVMMVSDLSSLYNDLLKERNELSGIKKQIDMAGEGVSMYLIDTDLKNKYSAPVA